MPRLFAPQLPRFLRGVLVLGALAAAACGGGGQSAGGDSASGSTLDRIRQSGVVRVGYANEAPFAYTDSASGKLTGESPEVAREVFKRLGVKEVKGVLVEWGSLIPGLQAGRFDVIAAGMYITPERCQQVAFSNPTYSLGDGFLVKAGNPKNLHSYQDVLNNEDATLGVTAGTVEHAYARKIGIPSERISIFPDNASALSGVRSGRVDAFAGTSLTIKDLLKKSGAGAGLEQAQPFTDAEVDGQPVRFYGGFAFHKDDQPLVEALNRELAGFIGTPEHLALIQPLGFGPENLPGGVTAADLCSGKVPQP